MNTNYKISMIYSHKTSIITLVLMLLSRRHNNLNILSHFLLKKSDLMIKRYSQCNNIFQKRKIE